MCLASFGVIKMRYLLVSLILHASLLFLIGIKETRQFKGNSSKKGADANTTISTKTVIAIELSKLPKSKGPKAKRSANCKSGNWYAGIGIIVDYMESRIETVIPNYPAHASGLKSGDLIKSIASKEGPEIRGPLNTKVSILIFRPATNETLLFNLIREKICTEAKKNP